MKILNRADFINEVYNPMVEEKEYRELQKINEGLLKNLFGKIRSLFSDDWKKINGNEEIKKVYKEMDDQLTGFTTMKMSKRDQCNKIRQELVDFACDWYEYKVNKAKDNDGDPKIAKSLEFKDETLKENLEKCQKNIKEIADGDNQMIKWANILMDDMKIVINKLIVQDIDDEETKKKVEEEEKKTKERMDKINKMMEPFQKKQLQKIKTSRTKQIKGVNAEPIDINLLGDKAIQNISSEFKKLESLMITESFDEGGNELNESVKLNKQKILNTLNNDSILGFKSIFPFTEKKDIDDNFKTTYKLMKMFYDDKTGLAKTENTDKFKEVPGQSVQAMCIAVNAFLKDVVYGNDDYSKELPLMSACAIVSNGIISYNLPIVDEKNGINYYTQILKNYSEMKANDDLKLPNDFKKNSDTLFNKIINEAKTQKEKAEKEYDDEVKKLDLNK